MPQLNRITFHSGAVRNFKCPYHSKVIKMFEMVSRMTVRKVGPRGWNQRVDVAQKDERYSSGHPLGP